MRTPNAKKIALAVFVLLAVSLSCSLPRFTPEGVDLDDESSEYLNNDVAGEYETQEFDDLSEFSGLESQCAEPPLWKQTREETLTFEGNKLIISSIYGPRTYTHQPLGTLDFCRELEDGRIECISDLQNNSYAVSIYESKDNFKQCFYGVMSLNRTGPPPVAVIGGDGAGDGDGGNEGGEGGQGNTEPDQGSGSDEGDPVEPAPDLEPPPDVCVAYPEDYTWAFYDTTIETGSRGTVCQGTFRLENTSSTRLIVYAYKETSTGSDADQYAGYGAGGRILGPGDLFEDRVNHTVYDNGDETFKRYPQVLVLYYTPDCLWMDPETADAEQIADSFVVLLDPCSP